MILRECVFLFLWEVKFEVFSILGEITETILRALNPSLDWGSLMDLSSDWGALMDLSSNWGALMDLSSDWGLS